MDKQIIIAADHAGYDLKQALIPEMESNGYQVNDLGTSSGNSVDYPDFAHPLAEQVASEKDSYGVLICGSANGVAMTANKHAGIRAAVCWTAEIARLARQHNDANVICLPARFVSVEMAKSMVSAFLKTTFEGGRHERRVEKIGVTE